MLSLLDLDERLVEIILELLPSSDLSSLCLSCKSLLPFARRRLFRHIILKQHTNVQGRLYIAGIFDALEAQPGLARSVDSLELKGPKPNVLSTTGNHDAHAAGHANQDSTAEPWLIQPSNSNLDAKYVSLISRFKGLRHLGLGMHFAALSLQVDKSFDSLHIVEFIDDDNDLYGDSWLYELSSVDPLLVTKLFHLPTIEQMHIIFPPTQLMQPELENLPLAPSLTTIYLRETLLDPADLAKILSKTPQLRRLFFSFYEDRDKAQGYNLQEHLSMERLLYALLHVSSTLEDLELSLSWADGENPGGNRWNERQNRIFYGIEGRLGPLTAFASLTRLRLPLVMLLGFFPSNNPTLTDALPRTLPPNLRYLCLSNDLSEWVTFEWKAVLLDSCLCSWIPHLRLYVPLLERFDLVVWTGRNNCEDAFWTENDPNLVGRLCKDADIEGTVTYKE
ncbi:hypothetical protein EV356DRAFT_502977 [Viridothelium virens]|uniref:F-box domain-containing protein n=1 Tax=Viridothelium virens TaxID=1048519 RepID=A0A6A6H7M5_VIRVR|nr:hypothetical protein EV356DRAFT_502977 [Viridothelium virens]